MENLKSVTERLDQCRNLSVKSIVEALPLWGGWQRSHHFVSSWILWLHLPGEPLTWSVQTFDQQEADYYLLRGKYGMYSIRIQNKKGYKTKDQKHRQTVHVFKALVICRHAHLIIVFFSLHTYVNWKHTKRT